MTKLASSRRSPGRDETLAIAPDSWEVLQGSGGMTSRGGWGPSGIAMEGGSEGLQNDVREVFRGSLGGVLSNFLVCLPSGSGCTKMSNLS